LHRLQTLEGSAFAAESPSFVEAFCHDAIKKDGGGDNLRQGVSTDSHLREAQQVTKSALQVAGWIAAASASLTAPLFVFQLFVARTGPTLGSIMVQSANVLLFLYVLSKLRTLLLHRHFTGVNSYINAIIGVTLCVQVMALFATELPVLAMPILLGFVILGILYLVTGIKLLDVASAMPGMKLVSYSAIVTGVCSASIVLGLLVLPASMAMNIGLAIVFLREAQVVGTSQAKANR
jgi:hypothetical protein